MRYLLLITIIFAQAGCALFPEVAHQPVVHNPFPQLTKVAVAPFFNLSTEKSVDGRQFALAYFNELQLVQGFQVVPVGVVENAIKAYNLPLDNPGDFQKLAQILEVDAIVVGAVTDFSPYYPPRCGLRVEWYAANPCFHPIPPGYGLPWGTTQEEYIPAPLVFEAEMALAREQLKTQTPPYKAPPVEPVMKEKMPALMPTPDPMSRPAKEGVQMSHKSSCQANDSTATIAPNGQSLPAQWPDARGFIPQGPCANPPDCQGPAKIVPVLEHTKTYNGHDSEFTEALASYVFFQDDARNGGWQSYLQRTDDFIRFCCHMHIFEMLSARGGAGETRVVWRWSHDR
jgi:hypothetical protein